MNMNFTIEKLKQNNLLPFTKLFKKIILNLDETIYSAQIKKDLITSFTKEFFEYHIQEKNSHYYIVKDSNNNLCGFIFGYNSYGVSQIEWIGVDLNYRNKNLGTNLLNRYIECCKNNKIHKITLTTIAKNLPAIQFYKKYNFKEELSLVNHWYRENWITFIKEL